VTFKIIMTTSVTRLCFTTSTSDLQDQDQDQFFGLRPVLPKTDGLGPHHCQTP